VQFRPQYGGCFCVPSMLDDLGAGGRRLEWQGREVFRGHSQIEVTVETEAVPEDLPDEYKTCIYRLVQEAVEQCDSPLGPLRTPKVTVERTPLTLTVQVSDDGKGLPNPSRSRRDWEFWGWRNGLKRLGRARSPSNPNPGKGRDRGPAELPATPRRDPFS